MSTLQIVDETKAYTEQHELHNLFFDIIQDLFIAKPNDPKAHIIQFLKKSSKKAAKPKEKQATNGR